MEKVYEFRYTSCIYESDMRTISIHKTLLGAYKAMRKFLTDEYNLWYNERIMYGKYEKLSNVDKFGYAEHWDIKSTELKE